MITIRDALETDSSLLTAAEQSIAATPGFLVPRPHEYTEVDVRRKIAELSRRTNGKYIVAESNGAIVGHALLDPMGLEAIAHIVRLSIVVHAGHQTKGIGEAMIKHLITWAKAEPSVEKIELNVRATNERAIRLYQRVGFQTEGRLRNRIKFSDGHYADDVLMGLWL